MRRRLTIPLGREMPAARIVMLISSMELVGLRSSSSCKAIGDNYRALTIIIFIEDDVKEIRA